MLEQQHYSHYTVNDMRPLVVQAIHLLEKMYDEKSGLFSYSTRLEKGGKEFVSNFKHPRAHRYTVNNLAGLQKAKKSKSFPWKFESLLESYLQKQFSATKNPGDRGLLLYVLSDEGHDAARTLAIEILKATEHLDHSLPLQEHCWRLLGLCHYAERTHSSEAFNGSRKLWQGIQKDYWNRDSLFPYHAPSWRKRYVSFGTITYYLMALHAYSKLHDDQYAATIFRELTLRIIQLQGPQGEWAWFYDTVTGKVTDWYEVYSVHQEAMAMLFLLPALDDGLQEAKAAIEKSYRWLFGDNQLNVPIMTKDPFFSYRSIRRKETLESARRILRSAAVSFLGSRATLASKDLVEINTECRSYEMGWTVFVWANRSDFDEFLDLQLL